jgi:outer membrane protein assembly factor BamB
MSALVAQKTQAPPQAAAVKPSSGGSRYAALMLTAWVAGLFCAVICARLAYLHFIATTNDPWKSPQLLALKERLANAPNDQSLQEQIRKLDAEFRERFRRRIGVDKSGGWLLLGGVVVLVAASRSALKLKKRATVIAPLGDQGVESARLARLSRLSVVGTLATVSVCLIVSALAYRTLPLSPTADASAGPQTAGAPQLPVSTLSDFQANFPRFRGWDGSGNATWTNAPLSWDAKTGAGIAWQIPVPAPGHGSPVVWGNRLFLTGGTAARREVFSYNTENGQLLWSRAVESPSGTSAKADIFEDTGYAAPTPATDGRFVFAIFGNGDLAAILFDGTLAWSKSLGPLKNSYGHGASLAVWPGKLLVQLDQGASGAPGNSKLIAIEPATGRVLWERSRPVTASWATPIVAEIAGKPQIVASGMPWVIGYSGDDGTELWRAELLENEVVPSPILAGNLIVAVSPSSRFLGLRADGSGDVTKTAPVWTNQENVPDISTPVSKGGLVFAVDSGGSLVCMDAKDGKQLWAHDIKTQVQASPAIVGDRLFIVGLEGEAVVVEAGSRFQEIGRSELPDKFIASPAFADGRTFLRGETNLYCIGPKMMQTAAAK